MEASYSEVFDVCSATDAPSLLAVHTPIGMRPHAYLSGLFSSFRYFRYKGCTISCVPASSRDVDPAFISTAASGIQNAVHPADILNPILDLPADGTDLGAFIDDLLVYYGINGGPDSLCLAYPQHPEQDTVINSRLQNLYYQMLTSPGVDKHDVNTGFQVNGTPTVYDLASNIPMLPSVRGDWSLAANPDVRYGFGTVMNTSIGYADGRGPGSGLAVAPHIVTSEASGTSGVSEYPQIFTNQREGLGWMPTITAFGGFGDGSNTIPVYDVKGNSVTHRFVTLPKLLMHLFILPKCEVRQQFMRFVIHHHFEFADFHSSLGAFNAIQSASELDWNPRVVKYPGLNVAGAKSAVLGVPAYDMDMTSDEYSTDEMLRGDINVNEYQSVVTVNAPLISYSDGCSAAPSVSAPPTASQLPDTVSDSSAVVPSSGQSE